MATEIAGLVAQLANDSQHLNGQIFEAYGPESALTVWTEGGEWPAYDQRYSWSKEEVKRDLLGVSYDAFTTIPQAVTTLDGLFKAGHSTAAVAMDCGTGKSTKLVANIHTRKYGIRTIVVQPSMVSARALADYMASSGAVFVRNGDDMPKGRSIVYLGAGTFLDVAFKGKLEKTDVIVLDEAHCVTPVYEVARDILARVDNKVIMFTASTSAEYKTLRGVKLKMVEGITTEVSEHLAQEPNHTIVGVHDNTTYASSANMLIGATLPLRLLYETGLRPDPHVYDGHLVAGERVATKGEVVQMIGRLGRLKDAGTAYVHKDPKAFKALGVSLYDVLLNAMRSAMNLGGALDKQKAIKIWKASGLLSKSSGSSVTSIPVPSRGIALDSRPNSSDSERNDKRVSFGTPELLSGTDDSDEDKAPLHSRVNYEYKRRSSSSGGGSIVMDSSIVKPDGSVHSLVPSPTWRPFNRVGVKHQDKQGRGVLWLLTKVADCVNAGDTLYPCKFPRADRTQVTQLVREEARMVLAQVMIPSYSEMEALAVVTIWNDCVDSLGGRHMQKRVVSQFMDYFSGYSNFEKARVGGFRN